jgi:hypothetical protein
VFGTVGRLASKEAVLNAWAGRWGLTPSAPWTVELERRIPRSFLNEQRPTQVDASAEAARALILFECKFTEPDGGSCSQTKALGKGANKGKVQCNGNYQSQVDPVSGGVNRCALTGKGIRYWTWVPQVLDIDASIDHEPCPFRGGWYQWMRNLVACAALTQSTKKQGLFAVVYADGPFPMARKIRSPEWQAFTRCVHGRSVPVAAASYQELLAQALGVASGPDVAVLERLKKWVERKVATVAGTSVERT